jgi:3-deoxy-D-manno-octulosonic-acid transferase
MESQREQMPTGILRSAYGAAVTAATPLIAAGLACSARGRRRYAERFGVWESVPSVQWWLHGASVGEVQGLLPFIAAIRAQTNEEKILLSSTSPTGLDRGGERVEYRRLLPIDAGMCVRRALSSVHAERFVLAETELWPTFLSELHRRDVPCHIVNGRISDYTFAWYRRLRSIFVPILSRFRSVSVPNEVQRDRYLELGVRPEVLHVTGHTKYDSEPRVVGDESLRAARDFFLPGASDNAPVVTLGSLRPGEEDAWFAPLRDLRAAGAAFNVILAPRHMERIEYFSSKLERSGLSWVRWSERQQGKVSRPTVVLLDVMGKLEEAYAIASLAFIGGTLVDIGGHNPLEAAMYGVPVVTGPYTSVIHDVIGDMQAVNGCLDVTRASDVANVLDRVVRGDPTLVQLGERGQGVWLQHRGAAGRVLSVIEHG